MDKVQEKQFYEAVGQLYMQVIQLNGQLQTAINQNSKLQDRAIKAENRFAEVIKKATNSDEVGIGTSSLPDNPAEQPDKDAS